MKISKSDIKSKNRALKEEMIYLLVRVTNIFEYEISLNYHIENSIELFKKLQIKIKENNNTLESKYFISTSKD